MENYNMAIALSIIFCLTPILLAIHLGVKKNESREYKKRLGYIYGGFWAIAFLGYGWLFFN
ncbi:hypothetical protein I4641_01125 [Waterburya agarophytonicola K14]|uniref:Uncharacterized protein n=1 Tax=Waterburya agarophytonicola KI4 TaxID=2874699 RepID=A0A964BMS1_9CYAN|nr:hypothetical protein [Waterburya agarophytonicola]MCC0175582.1 hypothetical protein [Waterburya agarophytonicola KI4]